jgi:hypothetical protein
VQPDPHHVGCPQPGQPGRARGAALRTVLQVDSATAIRRLQLHASYVDDDVGELTAVLRDLLAQLDEDDARALLRHAYWRMPDVPTDALRRAGGGDDLLRRAAGRGPVVGSCPRCGRVVRARSRDDVDLPPSRPCAECRVQAPPARPGARRAGFGWEFTAPPEPWRPRPVARLTEGVRRWADDYPDADAG